MVHPNEHDLSAYGLTTYQVKQPINQSNSLSTKDDNIMWGKSNSDEHANKYG
jgi:hypothetical protein